jgi:pilus assembly protein Flp/PilA
MNQLQKLFRALKDRSGATAIEYALIGGMICVVIVAGAIAVGETTSGVFTDVSEQAWGED